MSSQVSLSPGPRSAVRECVEALNALRSRRLSEEEMSASPFSRVLWAVELTRRDLRRRPLRGGIYGKMKKELASKHVILWRKPCGTRAADEEASLSTSPTSPRGRTNGMFRVAPLERERAFATEEKKIFSATSRVAAMVRTRSRVYVPRFLVSLLRLEDCPATRLYVKRPELFAFSEDFLVMPNPAYYNEAFEIDPKRAAQQATGPTTTTTTPTPPKGFGLVAWWIHPELRKRSRFFSCHSDLRLASRLSPTSGRKKNDTEFAGIAVADVLDCAFDAAPYLYDVSDLDASYAGQLTRLEAFVTAHLAQVYGVFHLREDDVYFHRQHSMWSSPDRAWAMTLHLHVAVHRARTPACYCHSVSLHDLAARLRSQGKDQPSGHSFELLDVPDDPDDFGKVAKGLLDSGFIVSRPLTPADLAFDDLLDYTP